MQIKVQIDHKKADALIKRLSGSKTIQALSNALNDAAFEARKQIQAEMSTVFDRVTPYIKRSIQVTKSTATDLTAVVEPKYTSSKGVDPKKVLAAEIFGGKRRLKASEVLLSSQGLLPKGYYTVPGDECPLDAYGNIKRAYLTKLITSLKTRKVSKAGLGYFVARDTGRASHLAPGVWSRQGSDIKPVLMYVRAPSYKQRLDFKDKPVKAALAKFNPRFRYHMRNVLEGKA